MISVVIPTKNAGPSFRETLTAIRAQRLDEELEIVVVDSGSTDGTVGLCREFSVTTIEIRPEEFNHGQTRNLAIQQSKGELVALTVQDAIPADERWLSSLAEAVRSDENVAGACSRHIPHLSANLFIKQRIERGFLGRNSGRLVQSADMIPAGQELTTDRLYEIYAFNNVSSMLRRDVWARYPFRAMAFAEDLDWGKRVMDAGYSIIYEPGSAVYHSHQRGWAEEFKRSYVSQNVTNRMLGGRKRAFSISIMSRYFWRFFVYAVSLLVEPEIPGLGDRVSTSVYSFVHNACWYTGMTLANKSERLMAHGWFRRLDAMFSRGL